MAQIRIGTRIEWRGDFANNGGEGVVTAIEGGFFKARLDDGRELGFVPLALLSGPRWRVIEEPCQ
jgi:hypothetical protein